MLTNSIGVDMKEAGRHRANPEIVGTTRSHTQEVGRCTCRRDRQRRCPAPAQTVETAAVASHPKASFMIFAYREDGIHRKLDNSMRFPSICAAAQLGWLDHEQVLMETLVSIRRAGADIVLTYGAREAAAILAR